MSYSWQRNFSYVSLLAFPSLCKCTRLLLLDGGKREAMPWENPVDEPFSSGKDASSQQLCTMYCACIPTVLILRWYIENWHWSLADSYMAAPDFFQNYPDNTNSLVNYQGMKSHRLSLPYVHSLPVGQQRSPGCICPSGKMGGKGILNLRHFQKNQEDTDIPHKKMLPLIKQEPASLSLMITKRNPKT